MIITAVGESTAPDVKTCTGCKHSVQFTAEFNRPLMVCNHPVLFTFKRNVLTGVQDATRTDSRFTTCESNRQHGPILAFITETCGKAGRFYEPIANRS